MSGLRVNGWTHASCALVFTLLAVSSCGTSGASTFADTSADGGATPSGGGPGGSIGGDTQSCNGTSAIEGCACTTENGTAACWTGPASQRGEGACRDGTAQCEKKGEFFVWGPCEGQVLDCGGGGTQSGANDGGATSATDASATGDAGSPPSSGPISGIGGANCACVPGAVIWCDEDCVSAVYCSQTGQRTCLPDGTWGGCKETTNTKPLEACEILGLGCGDCNVGHGYLTGDCTSAFTCTPPVAIDCSVNATVNNGVASVTCNCH